jgi:hypothetical protein
MTTATTYPTLNRDLLAKVLAIIEEQVEQHPEEYDDEGNVAGRWDQNSWSTLHQTAKIDPVTGQVEPVQATCGTSYCFAGWAVTVDQQRPQWLASGYLVPREGELTLPISLYVKGTGERRTVQSTPVWERAQGMLGLTLGERIDLFGGSNTLDDLRRYVGLLLDGTRWEHTGDQDPYAYDDEYDNRI